MKKTVLFLMVIAAMALSCDKDDFLKDDCAIYDYGTVVVRNSSGIDLIVDVTFNEATENNPIALHYLERAVNLTYFWEIPRGRAVIWWRDDEEDWQHAFMEVEGCQEVLFEIQGP